MPIVIDDLIFTSLARGEVDRLAPALKEAKMTIAYPHLAEPIVAQTNGGVIVGFGFAQLIPHAEPIWVHPLWRGRRVANEIARQVVEKIEGTGARRFISIAQSPFAEQLCQENGMIWVDGKVYVKEPLEGG